MYIKIRKINFTLNSVTLLFIKNCFKQKLDTKKSLILNTCKKRLFSRSFMQIHQIPSDTS